MAEVDESHQMQEPPIEVFTRAENRTELGAVVFPEFGKRDESNKLQPLTETETLDTLQSFLAELNAQGADIVSILDVNVSVPETTTTAFSEKTETRKIAILRRVI